MDKDYVQMFEKSRKAMVVIDRDGTYLDTNHAYRHLLGYQGKGDLISCKPEHVSAEYQPDGTLSKIKAKQYIAEAYCKDRVDFPWLHRLPDGSEFLSKVHLDKITFDRKPALLVTLEDIEEEHKIHRLVEVKTEQIEAQNRLLESIYENSLVGMLLTDGSGTIVKVNARFLQMFKLPDEDLVIGEKMTTLYKVREHNENYEGETDNIFDHGEFYTEKLKFKAYDGSEIWCKVSGSALDRDHVPPDLSKGVIWVMDDITDMVRLEEALRQQYVSAKDANPLTGLPGNNAIKDHLSRSVEEKARRCVVYVDLDGFKAYNDRYGFAKGDDVLKWTAEILSLVKHELNIEDYFVGCIGGDDFVLVFGDVNMKTVAEHIIKKFDAGIGVHYKDEDLKVGSITSVGRNGHATAFPIMGISMAGVCLEDNPCLNYLEVIDACTELKYHAKSVDGSFFAYERRKQCN